MRGTRPKETALRQTAEVPEISRPSFCIAVCPVPCAFRLKDLFYSPYRLIDPVGIFHEGESHVVIAVLPKADAR